MDIYDEAKKQWDAVRKELENSKPSLPIAVLLMVSTEDHKWELKAILPAGMNKALAERLGNALLEAAEPILTQHVTQHDRHGEA
jgi:hypothetical protein